MIYSREEVSAIAEKTGFKLDIVEKVTHLIELLNTLFSHPFLKERLALKGGTALNLFYFDIPRLSVDIDLNLTGSIRSEELALVRPKVEEALQAVFSRENYILKRVPTDHAGGKWRLGYQSFSGNPGIIEVDLNYMFRQPLFDPARKSSFSLGNHFASKIRVLDIHELAAGKLAALFSRHTPRDIFDADKILSLKDLEIEKLRTAFVVYGALNRKDWRKISTLDISPDILETEKMLLPLLHGYALPEKQNIQNYIEKMVQNCIKKLETVFPFKSGETEFLNRLLDHGEICPQLITDDTELQERILVQPMLNWKALNVKKFTGNK